MVRVCRSWRGWDISSRNLDLPHVYETMCPIEGGDYVHRVNVSLELLRVLVLRRDRGEKRSRDQRLLQVRAISHRSNDHAGVCIADVGAVDSPFRAAAGIGLPSAVVYKQIRLGHRDHRRHGSSPGEYVGEAGLMDVGVSVEDRAHRSSDGATSGALLSLTCRSMAAHHSW